MSWFFAIVGKPSEDLLKRISDLLPAAHSKVIAKGLVVRHGGFHGTTHISQSEERGFVVCGLGLAYDDYRHRYLEEAGWSSILKSGKIGSVQGQFAGLSWDSKGTTAFNDLFGSRDIFYARNEECTLLCTRIDWLSRAIGGSVIDPQGFGGKWLHFYQLSFTSLLKGIDRLPPGGRLRIAPGSVHLTRERFDPMDSGTLEVEPTLRSQLLAIQSTPFETNVGLSGGIDSRLILSVLLSSNASRWRSFTLGELSDPDVVVTSQISRDNGFVQNILSSETDPPLSEAFEYAGHVMLLRPFTSFAQQRLLSKLADEHSVLIDGSYGEILRRYVFKRLSWFGPLAIMRKDAVRISKLAGKMRADIFGEEFKAQLESAALAEMEEVFNALPSPSKIGVANWIDLLVYIRGTPNLNASEQARTDHYVRSFMPFLQVPMLQVGMNMAVRERRNSRWVKRYIATHTPQLTRYPFAGLHTTYPFKASALEGYVRQRYYLKSQAAVPKPPKIFAYREFVLDTLSESSTRTNAYLDQVKVTDLRARFEHVDWSVGSQVDWLIAFLLWTKLAGVK